MKFVLLISRWKWRDEYLENSLKQAKIQLHNDDSYATEVNVIHIMSSIYRYERRKLIN